jgi:hypothetical protein
MNRKDEEKLAIPVWFKLENYAPLKGFAMPRPWLEQFALRIDLMAHWRKAIGRSLTHFVGRYLGLSSQGRNMNTVKDQLAPVSSLNSYRDDLQRASSYREIRHHQGFQSLAAEG